MCCVSCSAHLTRLRYQFAGGDEAEDAIPVLERLREENKGVLFVYSVEVDEAADKSQSSSAQRLSAHKQIVAENLHCIDVAADFEDKHSFGKKGKGTWVAIKLVGGRRPSQLGACDAKLELPSECDGTRRRITAATIQALGGHPPTDQPSHCFPGVSNPFRPRYIIIRNP